MNWNIQRTYEIIYYSPTLHDMRINKFIITFYLLDDQHDHCFIMLICLFIWNVYVHKDVIFDSCMDDWSKLTQLISLPSLLNHLPSPHGEIVIILDIHSCKKHFFLDWIEFNWIEHWIVSFTWEFFVCFQTFDKEPFISTIKYPKVWIFL
jgi:hypothetical protein